ncbi:MAG TPA: MFS transporter [Nocardioides sp.]|nr:MFS transporter [Nocardioides sp.]
MADQGGKVAAGSGVVLVTLASGQFLMALDSSVMNVSIAVVAEDLDTTVTGIQTAITMYMLVMAALMMTGGKLGQILGRKRTFGLGCVIYGCGSLTTSVAPNLAVLLFGWSLLEGIGAALIMPAIVALVATNFEQSERPRAYGMVAAFGAIAVAVGPLIGGLMTTYASWRYVFAGEVLIVLVILLLMRRMADSPPDEDAHMDLVGTGLSALGLGLAVYGILQAGSWGFVAPKPGAPSWFGLSPVLWLVLAGGVVLRVLVAWESHRADRGKSILLNPVMLRNERLRGGLVSFFLQYFLQSGLFFVVPLFLSISLGLSAIQTGLRLLPLSLSLLLAAMAIPRFLPDVSPRKVVRFGFAALFAGTALLTAGLSVGVGAEVVTVPMLLAGLGIGALASQLGSVTVSSVPDEESAEVGGLQNTVTFMGAAVGTALAGAILISALTTSFFNEIEGDPNVPDSVSAEAETKLASGVPFIPDDQLEEALRKAGVTGDAADAVVEDNAQARLAGLRAALAALALVALGALFAARAIPTRQPGSVATTTRSR